MLGEALTWDEDSLECGYVLHRVAGGGWWHLHFGRTCWSYHCDLLKRRTDILVCVQRFAAGAVTESPRFLLTLDGEGVELPQAEDELDCRWGGRLADADLAAKGLLFQREVVPLLYDSAAFQRATAEVVALQRHLRVVASGRLIRVPQELFLEG